MIDNDKPVKAARPSTAQTGRPASARPKTGRPGANEAYAKTFAMYPDERACKLTCCCCSASEAQYPTSRPRTAKSHYA